ncbi:MAG: hypothetical protein K6U80_18340, partial [Firmicutes bacterium]|nr:hypothetical protein [Bacillota bacterium]
MRDTTPDSKDLSAAIAELSSEISGESPIELIALYIELKISEWPACCSSGGVQEEAKAKGIDLALKYIPREVFDKRAVERNQVVFHDV